MNDTQVNQIGYLIIKNDGAVLESGGELENDEHSANIILKLLHLTESVDRNFIPNSSCERVSIVYDNHFYNVCLSNNRIYIMKLRSIDSHHSQSALEGAAKHTETDNTTVMSTVLT